jgi:hypothetical protein
MRRQTRWERPRGRSADRFRTSDSNRSSARPGAPAGALSDRELREENTIALEHGQPLVFGKGRDKGLRMNGLALEVVALIALRAIPRSRLAKLAPCVPNMASKLQSGVAATMSAAMFSFDLTAEASRMIFELEKAPATITQEVKRRKRSLRDAALRRAWGVIGCAAHGFQERVHGGRGHSAGLREGRQAHQRLTET